MNNEVTVVLACGHLTSADVNVPFHNAFLKCWACKEHVKWTSFRGMDDGWNIRCHGCRYARSFGSARLTAFAKARQHANKKRHRVAVRLDEDVQHEQAFIPEQSLDDAPPF